MKDRELTCIVCPRGCNLVVKFNTDGSIAEITGNACKRGEIYANDECTHPKRTVTSTVKLENGRPLPVKTSAAVPKELVFEVMKEINRATAKNGTRIGDVIIKNVCDSGADVIATANDR